MRSKRKCSLKSPADLADFRRIKAKCLFRVREGQENSKSVSEEKRKWANKNKAISHRFSK